MPQHFDFDAELAETETPLDQLSTITVRGRVLRIVNDIPFGLVNAQMRWAASMSQAEKEAKIKARKEGRIPTATELEAARNSGANIQVSDMTLIDGMIHPSDAQAWAEVRDLLGVQQVVKLFGKVISMIRGESTGGSEVPLDDASQSGGSPAAGTTTLTQSSFSPDSQTLPPLPQDGYGDW